MTSNVLPIINNEELSVSEISLRIKNNLEENFDNLTIKGEISGLKIASSGHVYFSLKDDKAVIAAICWRGTFSKIKLKLEEGLEVVVTGKITAYAGQSKYQLMVDSMSPSGVGAFMKILTQRKIEFQKEGLFSAEHKKAIPFLPRKIGIITSISGSVIRDIIHRITDRCGVNIVIYPVSVQGSTSSKEVASAIENFNLLKQGERPDLLIIARGGGSIEDLWSFNEEIVVRAAFASVIPIISAIGHETDYCLLDLVADLRAPTPTAAAEFAVPVKAQLIHRLNELQYNLSSKLGNFIKYGEQKIENKWRNISQHLKSLIRFLAQKIDDISFKHERSIPILLQAKEFALSKFSDQKYQLGKLLSYKSLQLANIEDLIARQARSSILLRENQLKIYSSTLSSLDYRKVLKRGYSILRSEENKIISNVSEAAKENNLSLQLEDGVVKIKLI